MLHHLSLTPAPLPSGRGGLIIAETRTWSGTPYCHQASLKAVGCDCLGLLRGVWRAVMGAEPEAPGPYSADWAEAGGGEPLIETARRHLMEGLGGEVGPWDV